MATFILTIRLFNKIVIFSKRSLYYYKYFITFLSEVEENNARDKVNIEEETEVELTETDNEIKQKDNEIREKKRRRILNSLKHW